MDTFFYDGKRQLSAHVIVGFDKNKAVNYELFFSPFTVPIDLTYYTVLSRDNFLRGTNKHENAPGLTTRSVQ